MYTVMTSTYGLRPHSKSTQEARPSAVMAGRSRVGLCSVLVAVMDAPEARPRDPAVGPSEFHFAGKLSAPKQSSDGARLRLGHNVRGRVIAGVDLDERTARHDRHAIAG